jgi:uncharacterized protein
MRLNEITYSGQLPVEGYGPGFFRIGGEAREAPLAILPNGVTSWRGFEDMATLLDQAPLLDVLLVGTGAEIAHVPRPFAERLEEAGIGVEPMASPQACRTYNVLLSEGRRVGLALLPV